MIPLHAEALQNGQVEVGKRHFSVTFRRQLLESAVIESTPGKKDGEIVIRVGIRVAHAATEED